MAKARDTRREERIKIVKINLNNSEYWVDNQISLSIEPRHFSILLDFDKGSAPKSVSWYFEIEISIALDGNISKESDIEIPIHSWKIEVELETKELDRFIQSPISRKLQIVKDHLSTGLDEFWGKNFG